MLTLFFIIIQMRLYHYTTIEALAMILKTRTIRFSRLDCVDDMEELAVSKNVRLGQYMFVSCWTENSEESIPLWKMYSGNCHGVRIGMEKDMFDDFIVRDIPLPSGDVFKGMLKSKIPEKEFLNPEYFILPVTSCLENSLFYCHVEYVNDVNKMVSETMHLQHDIKNNTTSTMEFGKIGKYKNKRWAFQQESRFRIVIIPTNPLLKNVQDASTIMFKSIMQNKPLSISEYYLSLRYDAINNMEITFHPNSSESDKVIVGALCGKYAPKAILKDSSLIGGVLLK